MFRRRQRPDSDFSEELRAHLELEADRLRSEGLSEEDARRAAHRNLGNIMNCCRRAALPSLSPCRRCERSRLRAEHCRQTVEFGVGRIVRHRTSRSQNESRAGLLGRRSCGFR